MAPPQTPKFLYFTAMRFVQSSWTQKQKCRALQGPSFGWIYLRIGLGIRCGRIIGRVELLRHGLEFLHVQAGIARRRHFAFDAQVLEYVADLVLVVHATRTEEGLDGVLETLEPSVNFQQIDGLAEQIHRQVEGSRSWNVRLW